MDSHERHSSDSDHDTDRPSKRPRHSDSVPAASASSSSSALPQNMHSTAVANGNGHAHDAAQHPGALPPLSLSILGVEPIDEFIREVADFIHYHISSRPQELGGHVEVEAKIGILRDRESGQRLQLPVLVETILTPNAIDLRFESNMLTKQHQHFNKLLNNLRTTPSPAHPSSTLAYQHLHLIDTFYAPEGGRGEKVRVTRDEKTGEVRECVRKIRLGDLNVYSPKRHADWRVSVNLEVPVPPPLGTPTLTRKKDRMSYSHEEFVIDLTQVTSTTGPNSKPEILHELELELARPEYLLATAAKRGDPNVSEQERGAFDELIRAFVNNARILARNADGGWH
ncbi:mRNA capping enzyme [Trametes punicea]|nr:mRNA capping enzyme [Trametes punicea]